MRTWKRAPVNMPCGYCREIITKGTPYEEIQSHSSHLLKHPKRRCERCAETERPPDIWTRTTAVTLPFSFSRFAAPAGLGREPGCDD